MKHIIKDALCSDYKALVRCPFIRKTQLKATLDKKFGSKAVERLDLLKTIDTEWNYVKIINSYSSRHSNNVLTYLINQSLDIMMVFMMVIVQCI